MTEQTVLVVDDETAIAEAVHPGEHQVEHDQVGFLGARQLQRLRAVGRDQDPEPLAREPGADGFGDRGLVVHHQDGLLGHRPIVAVGPSRPSGRVLRNRGADRVRTDRVARTLRIDPSDRGS